MNKQQIMTTLFLLQSLDGKISTGGTDERDFDKDLAQITGIKEGLHQYYEIEGQTDLVSFNSGRVLAKVGANTKPLDEVVKTPVSFVVVDNQPRLDTHGVEYMARKSDKLYIVTTNKTHPAYGLQEKYENIVVIPYDGSIDFVDLFSKLHTEYAIERMTIQTGGELNAILLRAGLIDNVLLVIVPCLVGGRTTTTLVDGEPLHTVEDLARIRPLKLKTCTALEDSYVRLEYEVVNS
jgi:2,5-diamino-6-(ribosylamino)-4(3H)-pyrimidinone 5'-phosphate reductase